jgi:predicted ATPase/transcriptional regulator with XRE-family HTH domain
MEEPAFAALLRRFRRERHLTQEQLAERAGVSPAAISLLERGLTHAPQKATMQLLVAALRLTSDEAAALETAARQARWPDGAAEEPAASAGQRPPENTHSGGPPVGHLPIPLTPLVGRERDEDALLTMLDDPAARLLTLTGPAGVGKTRLALRLAARLRDERALEVAFVDLIPVQEPGRVLSAIAAAIDVRGSGSLTLREALIQALRQRSLVLLLDNFEQTLSAARQVLELLVACPQVRALVTSRSPLNVRGERCYPVAPLALPDPLQMGSLDALRRSPTVALFLDRAAAVHPHFTITTLDEGRLVADICARLDGLPLAIELAAARIRHTGLRHLRDWLAQPEFLGALTDGPRDLADHQRTLRSAIAWSYDLLSKDEQRVFRWLGVFVGGASADAVEAVLGVDRDAALASLAALVNANLLQAVDNADARRFTQLVTIHAYAQERLRRAGEWEEAGCQHAAYFCKLTQRIDLRVTDLTDQPEGLFPLLELEYENIRSALQRAWETGATVQGLLMVSKLRRFWDLHAQFIEGLEWLERFVARAGDPVSAEERYALAQAFTGIVVMAHRLDRFERAREAGEAALELQRQMGDNSLVAGAMMNLANVETQLRDYARAQALYEACLALYRETNNRGGMVFPLLNLGILLLETGRPHEALASFGESLALSRDLGESDFARVATWISVGEALIVLDEPLRAIEVTEPSYHIAEREHSAFWAATCAFTLGRADWRLGAADNASAFLDEALHRFETLGSAVMSARVRYVRASLALEGGDVEAAQRDLAQALADLAGRPDASEYLWWLVERVGTLASRRGALDRAARLHGAAVASRDAAPRPLEPAERELRARDRESLRVGLGEAALATLLAEGQTLTLDAAVAMARQELAHAACLP